MKQFVLRVIWKLCKKVEKSRASARSATEHNALDNVESLNQSRGYWLKAKSQDEKFINAIYLDILNLARIKNGLWIADVGCGTGVLVDKLISQFPESRVQGFDFSSAKIEQCKKHYGQANETFDVHDIYVPFSEKRDVLVATEVLEHLEKPELALKNLIAGLVPSGRAFITVPNGREDTFRGHIHFWSPESWSLFLESALTDQSSVQTGLLSGKNFAVITKNEGC